MAFSFQHPVPIHQNPYAIALIPDAPRHSQAILSISEVVTTGTLYAVKGVTAKDPDKRSGSALLYPWLRDNYGHLFPKLPERSRRFRRLHTQCYWTGRFLATPTLMGIADSYGVALRHPIRDGRRAGQIGRKGISNQRRIAGGKFCAVVNRFGLICAWDCARAQCPRPDISSAAAAIRWPDGCAGGLGVSPGGGGSGQCDDLPAWAVECVDESGDGIFNAECEVRFQGAASSGVGVF